MGLSTSQNFLPIERQSPVRLDTGPDGPRFHHHGSLEVQSAPELRGRAGDMGRTVSVGMLPELHILELVIRGDDLLFASVSG